nr:PREDICTED: LEM domain-containing protein 1 isoform X1 [Latimeria chalumnae]XP_014340095.1 PREDICTED: LEM domain-containing protein 1 isoform X1 [Latimeria chalumnae]XP_014340096.1 PREDICTED: LEM domain-containing protein 1 isoform X1 [Latimeria chalumnae]|eukprot:XP_014340094.1 PREDICTED: LEM domain-containing protein 1 isoform X1 [Latimeria chalumnae]
MDVRNLSNNELKEELIKYGIIPGPIVDSTRDVYEKKLIRLLGLSPAVPSDKQNGTGDLDRLSDGEEEVQGFRFQDQSEPWRDVTITTASSSSNFNQNLVNSFFRTSEYSNATVKPDSTFSIAEMVHEMEKRSPMRPVIGNKKMAELSRQQSKLYTKADNNIFLAPPETFENNDVLKELFPEENESSLGVGATRRRPIKGAAGRPVQFQYDSILTQVRPVDKTLDLRQNSAAGRLVPVWVQITAFTVIAFFLFWVYQMMESNQENPFVQYIENSTSETQPMIQE